MRLKFKTTLFGNDKIPLLDVIITNPVNGNKVGYTALLDSGAFMNVFHKEVVDVLDIDLSKIKEVKFGGVGSKTDEFRGKPYIVNIMIAKDGKSYNFDSYILFSENINPDGNPLLGRMGFMDQLAKTELLLKEGKFFLYF